MLKYALPLVFAVSRSAVYSLLLNRLGDVIPFNKLLGIEIESIEDGIAVTRLPFRAEITNHIGTVHATAIYGLAEAASGCAMSGAFAPQILKIRPVAVGSQIRFLKTARTDLRAHARCTSSSSDLRKGLADEGKVVFDVVVDVRDNANAEIAQVSVTWHVSARK